MKLLYNLKMKLGLLGLSLILFLNTYAQTKQTWTGNNQNWDTSTPNWNDSTWINSPASTAVFGPQLGNANTVTVNVTTPITVGGISFSSPYVISGSTITPASAATVFASTSAATINSVIAGTNGLTVSGSGQLTFVSPTYTGATLLNGGNLTVTGNWSSSSFTNVTGTNSTLTLTNGSTTQALTQLSNNTGDYGNTNFNLILNNYTYTTPAVQIVYNNGGHYSNVFANMYINNGSTVVTNSIKVGNITGYNNLYPNLYWNDGTIKNQASSTTFSINGIPVTLGASGTHTMFTTAGAVSTLASGITGAGGLTFDGGGSAILNGANTYTGTTTITNAGATGVGGNTLNLSNASGAAILGNVSIGSTAGTNGAVLKMNGANEFGASSAVLSPISGSASYFLLNGYNQTIAGLSSTNTSFVVENDEKTNYQGPNKTAILTVNNGYNSSFDGVLRDNLNGAGVIALTKTGNGQQTISGTATYSGTTTVLGGILAFTGAVPASNLWAISTGTTTPPQIALPSSPNLTGKTVNVSVSLPSQGTYTLVNWPSGSASGSPTLQLNGATVTSGVASGAYTLTYSVTAGISLTVAAPVPPSAPLTLAGTPGNASVALTWSAPTTNGSALITDYKVEYSSNSGASWTAFPHTASAALASTVTGLTNGVSYIFRVSAINVAGTGTASANTAAILPATGNQIITFNPATQQLIGASFTISATSTSGLPVAFSTTNSSLIYVTDNGNGTALVKPLALGTATVTASQAGNGTNAAATPVSKTITILSGPLTWTGNSQVWDISTPNWNGINWINSPSTTAIFGPLSGGANNNTIAVTVPINIGGMTFTAPYTITGGALTTTTSPVTTISASTPVTINSVLTGSNGVTFTGVGPLTIASPTYTGATVLSNANVVVTGNLTSTSFSSPSATTNALTLTNGANNQPAGIVLGNNFSNSSTTEFDLTLNNYSLVTPSVALAQNNNAGGVPSGSNIIGKLYVNNGSTLVTNKISQNQFEEASFGVRNSYTSNLFWNDGTIGNQSSSTTFSIDAAVVTVLGATGNHTLNTTTGAVSTINPAISGAGSLVFDGGGSAILVAANTYTGSTIVNNAGVVGVGGNTLSLANATGPAVTGNVSIGASPLTHALSTYGAVLKMNASNQFGASSAVSSLVAGASGSASYFLLNGYNQTIAGLSSTNTSFVVENDEKTNYQGPNKIAVLTVNNSTDGAFDGVLRDNLNGAGVLALTKSGAGKETISGTPTYTGITTVQGGILAFTGAVPASTLWTVATGAGAPPQITLPASPNIAGKTLNVTVTLTTPGIYSIVNWPSGTATGTPTLQVNGTTVSSGIVSGSYTLTYTPATGITLTIGSPVPPSAPLTVAGVAGNGSVALTWAAPSSNGFAVISDYKVEYSADNGSTWTVFAHTPSANLSSNVTGLVNAVSYVFRVSAINQVGTGVASANSAAVIPVYPSTSIPAPTALAGTPQNTQVALSWTAPATNGGSAITDYTVWYSSNNGTNWTAFVHTASPATNITVTGLGNGTSYIFQVAAVNTNGIGATSASSGAVIPAVSAGSAGAPTAVTGVAGDKQVVLSWTAPSSTGTSPISDYRVSYSSDNGTTWVTFVHTASASATMTVTGLTDGTSYIFQVAAVNASGVGNQSASSAAVTPVGVAAAPVGLSVIPLTSTANLSWNAPLNGGIAITDYTIQYSSNNGTTFQPFAHTASTATAATVSGLTNGTTYLYQVAAVNSAGTGPFASITATQGTQSAPLGFSTTTVIAGDQKVSLSWSLPVSNGTSAITDYAVQYSSDNGVTWTSFVHTASTNTTAVVTGLTNGTKYLFTVASVNAAGTGTPTSSVLAIPNGLASAPLQLTPIAGFTQVALTWSQPATPNGSTITDYIVQYSKDNGTTWVNFAHAASSNVMSTVNALTNGTPYIFRVAAVNLAGTGAFSANSVVATPIGVPGAPTNLAGTPANAQVLLTWSSPASNGGPITDYSIQYSADNGATWNTFTHAPFTSTTTTVTGLTNGTPYVFQVAAVNSIGTGLPSVVSSALTPIVVQGVASAPTGLTTSTGDQQVVLTWTAPSAVGSSAITDYLVQYSPDGGTTWLTFPHSPSPSTTIAVNGLTDGTAYLFRVAAVNGSGIGALSASSNSVTPSVASAVVPSAPLNLTTTPQNSAILISWTAPASTGGSLITSYSVQMSPNGTTWSNANQGTTVSNSNGFTNLWQTLTNGTSYSFRVAATNATGTGPYANVVTGIPAAPIVPAGIPTALTSTAGDGSVALSWAAPTNTGGAAISDYLVEYSTDNGVTWITYPHTASASNAATVSGLTNGTSYTFRVSAVNSAGIGSSSQATASSPGTASVPTALTAVAGNAMVTLSWTAPATGTGISDYTVQSSVNNGATWTAFAHTASTSTTAIVNGLTNGTAYVFQVAAVNTVGTGSFSNTASATPATVPTAPTGVTGTGGSPIQLYWTAASNGGSAITDYKIVYSSDNGVTWTPFTHTASSATTAAVTGLTNGTSYIFQVAAINAIGTSAVSTSSASLTYSTATIAAAPSGVAGISGNAQVTVSWTAPNNQGSVITDYKILYSSDNGVTWLTFAHPANASTTMTVIGLTNGTAYIFQVAAINSFGTGALSASSAPVTPALPAGTASAPTSLTATPASGQVALSWTAPTNAGSSPTTDYQVQYSIDNGKTWTIYPHAPSTATTATVTGLANGVNYIFQVAAINTAGAGALSASSTPVSPAALSNAPTGVTGVAGNAQVVLSWIMPGYNGGSAITDYQVSYSSDNGVTWTKFIHTPSTSITSTITGLTNGTAYIFNVAAVTAGGIGTLSANSGKLTPGIAPDAPTGLMVLLGNLVFNISWTAPANTGSSPITQYVIDYSYDGVTYAPYNTGNTQTSFTTGTQANGTIQYYKLAAVNAFGTSTFTAPVGPFTAHGSQKITFAAIADVTLGDAPFNLSATSSAALPVTFTDKQGKVSITGIVATPIAAGRDTIVATQVGNSSFLAATPVYQSFCVNPKQPLITAFNANTKSYYLQSNATSGNVWFLNGNAINGAKSDTLTIRQQGIYTVQSVIQGCKSVVSTDFPVIVTGVEIVNGPLSLYPNPSADYISVAGINEKVIESVLINTTGVSQVIKLTVTGDKLVGDVRSLPSGVYILKIATATETLKVRFVKL